MIIYVIEDQTGEYSDNRNWLVKAFRSEQQAKDFVEKVSEEYRKLREKYGGVYWYHNWDGDKDPNPLDPYMETDYTGTTYCHYSLELEEDE